jgi:hypothetical protein
VAEQGCLLSSYPDKIGIGGSNPPLSAIHKSQAIRYFPDRHAFGYDSHRDIRLDCF